MSGTALTAQPDFLAVADPGRDFDIQGAGMGYDMTIGVTLRNLQLQRPLSTLIGFFQGDLQRYGLILAGGLETAGIAAPPGNPGLSAQPTEERFKKVAEILLAEAPGIDLGTRPALPARRWPEILPGLPVAAQLIIGGAFFRIAQHLVSFGNRFEMLLGLRLLADCLLYTSRCV